MRQTQPLGRANPIDLSNDGTASCQPFKGELRVALEDDFAAELTVWAIVTVLMLLIFCIAYPPDNLVSQMTVGLIVAILFVLLGIWVVLRRHFVGVQSCILLDFENQKVHIERTYGFPRVTAKGTAAFEIVAIKFNTYDDEIFLQLEGQGSQRYQEFKVTNAMLGRPDIEPIQVARDLANALGHSQPIKEFYDGGGG